LQRFSRILKNFEGSIYTFCSAFEEFWGILREFWENFGRILGNFAHFAGSICTFCSAFEEF